MNEVGKRESRKFLHGGCLGATGITFDRGNTPKKKTARLLDAMQDDSVYNKPRIKNSHYSKASYYKYDEF